MWLRLKHLNGNSSLQNFVLKLIIGSIIIFSVVILFLFALFPSEISVSRILLIESSPAQVAKKITDLRDWKNWNELLMNSISQNQKNYPEPGLIDSNYIGLGYLTIELLKAGPDSVITRWQRGNKSFMGNFILSPQGNGQTILEWTLHFHIKWYPWDKLASMFYEKQLGPVMELSLVKLQKELQASGR